MNTIQSITDLLDSLEGHHGRLPADIRSSVARSLYRSADWLERSSKSSDGFGDMVKKADLASRVNKARERLTQ